MATIYSKNNKSKKKNWTICNFFIWLLDPSPRTSQVIISGLTGPHGHLGAAPGNGNYNHLGQILSLVFTLSYIEPKVLWYFKKQLLSFHSQCDPSFMNCQWKGSRRKEEFQEYNITMAS